MTQIRSRTRAGDKKAAIRCVPTKTVFFIAVVLSLPFVGRSLFAVSFRSRRNNEINPQKSGQLRKHVNVPVSGSKPGDDRIRIVFSTSCSPSQDWQSYLLFYSAMIQDQPGTVTRIAASCNANEAQALKELHEEIIRPMSNNFKLYVTDGDWYKAAGQDYKDDFHTIKYWNKPFGVKEWMESVIGYSFSYQQSGKPSFEPNPNDDSIIILIDPDFIFNKPIRNEFSTDVSDMWVVVQKGENQISSLYDQVDHGRPMAHRYSFRWRNAYGNLTHVIGANSPVYYVSKGDAWDYYAAGPPYVLTARDMYRVSKYWSDYVPRLGDLTDDFMMEMVGYSLASAHLGLKHQLSTAFMVSNPEVGAGSEGWSFLDGHTDDVCRGKKTYSKTAPYFLHYCQEYSIGEYSFKKYFLAEEILTSCKHPLMAAPPIDVASTANYSHWRDGSITVWDGKDGNKKIYQFRNAFMTCSIIKLLNQAATYYRDHHCGKGSANYNGTWTMTPSWTKGPAAPDFTKLYWADLGDKALEAAKLLGFTKELWDNDSSIPIYSTPFGKLGTKEKDAATYLGLQLYFNAPTT